MACMRRGRRPTVENGNDRLPQFAHSRGTVVAYPAGRGSFRRRYAASIDVGVITQSRYSPSASRSTPRACGASTASRRGRRLESRPRNPSFAAYAGSLSGRNWRLPSRPQVPIAPRAWRKEVQTLSFDVERMTCFGCRVKAEYWHGQLAVASRATFSLQPGVVTIVRDPLLITQAQVISVINEAGFLATENPA